MTVYELIKISKEDLEKLADNPEKNYISFPIKKSNGSLRWIDAPINELKNFQRNFLFSVIYKFTPHVSAIGFIQHKSIIDGAKKHINKKTVISLDIQNFFPSIKLNSVYKVLSYIFIKLKKREIISEYSKEDLELFVKLLTYKGQLPQGSPASPGLSNIVCLNLDKELLELSLKNGFEYSRYADDLSFSSDEKLGGSQKLSQFLQEVNRVCREKKFLINRKKTKVFGTNRRMMVTGVVVNTKLSVPKYKWRNFKAKLHNLIKANTIIDLKTYQQLRGYCEWIKSLHPTRGQVFLGMLGKIQYQH